MRTKAHSLLEEMRKRTDAVQAFIAFKDVPMAATIDAHAEMINGEFISGNAFQWPGLNSELGRTLTGADDAVPGSGPVVIIRDGFGRRDSCGLLWFSGR